MSRARDAIIRGLDPRPEWWFSRYLRHLQSVVADAERQDYGVIIVHTTDGGWGMSPDPEVPRGEIQEEWL